jgi:hypothetical protein
MEVTMPRIETQYISRTYKLPIVHELAHADDVIREDDNSAIVEAYAWENERTEDDFDQSFLNVGPWS